MFKYEDDRGADKNELVFHDFNRSLPGVILRGIGDRAGSKCEVDFDECDSDFRSGAFGVDDFCDGFCGLKSDGVL